MIGMMFRKNLIDEGSRPSSAALARTEVVYFLVDSMFGLAQKIASACLPPNWTPALEEPEHPVADPPKNDEVIQSESQLSAAELSSILKWSKSIAADINLASGIYCPITNLVF